MSKASSYKLQQMFGYKGINQKIHQEDIINVMKFNSTGDFLALGDKAGRVIVFQTNKKTKKKQDLYDYYAQFQAHSKEFDPLKSQEVDQTITDICWLNSQNKYQKLLTSNSKTIKLWKIFEKTQKRVNRSIKSPGNDLKIPPLETVDSSFIANTQLSFPSKHQSDIHSISNSFNEEYLLSFDSVQGYMWNLQRTDKPYIIVDYLKGKDLEDVKQNITCGSFHPTSDSILAYGTNKRTLKIHDMRLSSRQSEGGIHFKYEQKDTKNFFTDLISNYSSVQFLRNGKYLAVRDFLTVKLWDICQNKKPLLQIPLQQNYKQKLCQMFQNDCVYDRFKLAGSSDGSMVVTGNYNNNFHVVDLTSGGNCQYEVNYKKQTTIKSMVTGKNSPLGKMDYDRKVSALDFSHGKNLLAVASLNCFFVYSL